MTPCHPVLDADAGIRTRVTVVTGPHDGRTTPRRHVRQSPQGESNPRLRAPKARVPRQRRLWGCAQPQLCVLTDLVPVVLCAVRIVGPHVHTAVRDDLIPERRERHPATPAPNSARNRHWVSTGGRPVFPRPERVVRVGAGLCGQTCPDVAGAHRAGGFAEIALPANSVRLLRTLVT